MKWKVISQTLDVLREEVESDEITPKPCKSQIRYGVELRIP